MRRIVFSFFMLLCASVPVFCQALPFPGPGSTASTSIPSPSLWMSADCITAGPCANPADGTNITTWADRTGNGHTGTVASGTCTLHTNQINGKPSVTFSTCHLGIVSLGLNDTARTIFVVMAATGGSTQQAIISGNNGSITYWVGSGGKLQGWDNTNFTLTGTGTASMNSSWHQINVQQQNDPSIVKLTFRLDRASDTTIPGSPASPLNDELGIGWYVSSGGSPFAGRIAEIIYYNSVLSSPDIATVEAYLHTKYGL